jgi:nitroreductase
VARADEYIAATHIRTHAPPFAEMIAGHASGLEAGGSDAVKIFTHRQMYIALGFALAAAAEHHISTCPLEGFNAAAIDEILGLPATMNVVGILAVGREEIDAAVASPHSQFRFPKDELVKMM